MKVIIKIIFIILLSYISQWYFPWWCVVIASFLINLILYTKGSSSFLSGFLGVGLLWLFAAFTIELSTDSILTEKIAQLFNLPNSFLLVLITGLIGGLAGGFGGLSGSLLRRLFKKERRGLYYQ